MIIVAIIVVTVAIIVVIINIVIIARDPDNQKGHHAGSP